MAKTKFLHAPTPAPAAVDRYAFIPFMTAIVLAVMLLAQLVTFDRFEFILQDYGIMMFAEQYTLVAAVLVTSELFALPFLLRMSVSPLMRQLSVVSGYVAALIWLVFVVVAFSYDTYLSNTGYFGSFLPQSLSWITLAEAILLTLMIGFSSYVLRAGDVFVRRRQTK